MSVPGEPPPQAELVASAGALDDVVVLLREVLHVSRANRAIAVVEGAPGEGPATVDVERLMPIEVTLEDRVLHLPHAIALEPAPPRLPEFKDLPMFDVDQESGEVAAPLGGVEHYAIRTRETAALLGVRDVLQLRWDTTTPQVAFSVTVRGDASEPIVLGVGEEAFEMEPGWPERVPTEGGEPSARG